MRKFIILLVILIFPSAFYVYLSFGATRYKRTPIYGPRTVINPAGEKPDTAYFTIPAFRADRIGGGNFDISQFKGRMYVAAFLDPDSADKAWNIGPLLTDYKVNKKKYYETSFLFFWPQDSTLKINPPDLSKEMKLKGDTVVMVTMPMKQLDSLRAASFFVPDPKRVKEPFTRKMYDLVFVDGRGRIRGYYNGRYLGKVKELKEDILHVRIHDEAFETVKNTKIDPKKQ